MLTSEEQMQIIKDAITSGYNGPIFKLLDEGHIQKAQIAATENQQEQGLRGSDGNTAMAFPDSSGDFNTQGMDFDIDIRKYDNQGNLVKSYNKVPPGVKNLQMGEGEGTVIETPSQYQDGGEKEENSFDAVQWNKDWINSPMHASMLQQEDPKNADYITKARLQNLNNINIETHSGFYGSGDSDFAFPDENVAGTSNSATGDINYYPSAMPSGEVSRSTQIHEVSHSSDRPINPSTYFKNASLGDVVKDAAILTNNPYYSRLFDKQSSGGKNYFLKRLIPESSQNLIHDLRVNENLEGNYYDLRVKKEREKADKLSWWRSGREINQKRNLNKKVDRLEAWPDYVTDPTETRARLNAIREYAQTNNIYDPFTQKINREQFIKLDDGSSAPLRQLKGIYKNEEILKMLNTISFNNQRGINTDQNFIGDDLGESKMAQKGGFDSKSTLLPEIKITSKSLKPFNTKLERDTIKRDEYGQRINYQESNEGYYSGDDGDWFGGAGDPDEIYYPIVAGKSSSKNKDRPNMGGNTLGIKHHGQLDAWFRKHSLLPNFGYKTLDAFLKDWPNASYSGGRTKYTDYVDGDFTKPIEKYGDGKPGDINDRYSTIEGGPEYKVNPEPKISLKPKKIKLLPTDDSLSEPILKKVDIPKTESLKDKVKDVSFDYSNYGGVDDAGVMDKHGRYFTLTLKDGSKMRLAPSTYRNYFGTESLMTPGKKLKVFKKEGGFAKYQKGGFNPDHLKPTLKFPPQFPQGRIEKGASWDLKKGVRALESSNGINMKNKKTPATGYYGQFFTQIKDLPFMDGVTRDEFAADTTLQNKVFDMRYKGDIPDVPGLKSNVKKLRKDYKELTKDYTNDELAALSNFTGRKRAREYFASIRDGKPFEMPGQSTGDNKSVEQYMKEFRDAVNKKKMGGKSKFQNGGFNFNKKTDYSKEAIEERKQSVNWDNVELGAAFAPYLGEAIDAKNTVKSLKEGKYGDAALHAAGFMLPFVPGKALVKGYKKLFGKADEIVPMKTNKVGAHKISKEGHASWMKEKIPPAKYNTELVDAPKNTHRAVRNPLRDGEIDYDLLHTKSMHNPIEGNTPITTKALATEKALEVNPNIYMHGSKYNVGMSTSPNKGEIENFFKYRLKDSKGYYGMKEGINPRMKGIKKWDLSYGLNPNQKILNSSDYSKFMKHHPVGVQGTKTQANILEELGYTGVKKFPDSDELQFLNPKKSLFLKGVNQIDNLKKGGMRRKCKYGCW